VEQRHSRQVHNNPQPEDGKVEGDETHAASEAGDAIGQSVPPAPVLLFLATTHEEGADVALDDLSQVGRFRGRASRH
jgi:hypothetical protein